MSDEQRSVTLPVTDYAYAAVLAKAAGFHTTHQDISRVQALVNVLLDEGWRPLSVVGSLRRRVDEQNLRLLEHPCELPEHRALERAVRRAEYERDDAVRNEKRANDRLQQMKVALAAVEKAPGTE